MAGWGISGDIGIEIDKLLRDKAVEALKDQLAQAKLVEDAERLKMDRDEQAARREERAELLKDREYRRQRDTLKDDIDIAAAMEEQIGSGDLTPEQAAQIRKSPVLRGRVTDRKTIEGVTPVGGVAQMGPGGEPYTRLEPTRKQAEASAKEARVRQIIQGLGPRAKQAQEAIEAGIPASLAAELMRDPNADLAEDVKRERALQTVRKEFETPPKPDKPQYIQVEGPDGTLQVFTADEIRARGGVKKGGGAQPKPTESEKKSGGLLQEAQNALVALEELESKLTDRDLYQIQSLPQEGIMGGLNRSNMSPTALRYLQALDQFIEARLRPLSGATITPQEYAQGRRTFGRQYGETPELSVQRKAARQAAVDTIRGMAGVAGTPPTVGEIVIERDPVTGKLVPRRK